MLVLQYRFQKPVTDTLQIVCLSIFVSAYKVCEGLELSSSCDDLSSLVFINFSFGLPIKLILPTISSGSYSFLDNHNFSALFEEVSKDIQICVRNEITKKQLQKSVCSSRKKLKEIQRLCVSLRKSIINQKKTDIKKRNKKKKQKKKQKTKQKQS
jgi:hypothetical protein